MRADVLPTTDQVNERALFRRLSDSAGSVWLNSATTDGEWGRYSFIARDPVIDFRQAPDGIRITSRDKTTLLRPEIDSLDAFQQLCSDRNLFFAGYITFEAAARFIDVTSGRLPGIPLMRFLGYESVLELDHLSGTVTPTNPDMDDYSDVLAVAAATNESTVPPPASVVETTSRQTFFDHVHHIREHITAGDIYQANYTVRFDVDSMMSPFAAYCRLTDLNSASYGAYLNCGDYQVLSSSPERMFLKAGNGVTTSPIKGTIACGATAAENVANERALLQSAKDVAENIMIVDVARNDLGRIAETGTVSVDRLCRVHRLPNMMHLVSDISARARHGVTLSDIIRSLLPGASISGAPKKRAVEIITELERRPRSVYTGCIGYVYRDRADFNVAIRTVVHQNGCYQVHAGGAIVADSCPDAEYREMLLKAKNLLLAPGVREEQLPR